MNRDFVYDHPSPPSNWVRFAVGFNRCLWRTLCCGLPGIPCYYCTCCEKRIDLDDRDLPRGNRLYCNESTATAERIARQHRPHAPRGRKSTPEMLTAVRCALSQLQGEPAPPRPETQEKNTPEPG